MIAWSDAWSDAWSELRLPAVTMGSGYIGHDHVRSIDVPSYSTAVFHNLATAKASHMINMSDLTNQLAPITSAFHFPVARFWKTAVAS